MSEQKTATMKSIERRKERRRRMRADAQKLHQLSLTSLMDIVTNLLVYIIKIFVVSPIVVSNPSIDLPVSSSQERVEDAIVVMITGKTREEATAQNQMVEIDESPMILVNDKPIVKLDSSYRVPAHYKERGYVIPALKAQLLAARKAQAETAALIDGKGFTGKVAIVADKNTPYRVLTDVLVTCGEAGFGEFKFAIAKENG